MYDIEIKDKVTVTVSNDRVLKNITLNNYIVIKIRILRKQKKMNQAELGLSSGVSRSTIANIEGGTHSCGIDALEGICRSLGVKSGEILPF